MHSACQSSPYWSLSKKALDFILGLSPRVLLSITLGLFLWS